MDSIDDWQDYRSVRGRGTGCAGKGRFERLETVFEPTEAVQWETEVFRDTSRSIIARNDSPDIGFNSSLNPYRGCEHGCIYCYARPTHEYLGLSAGLDFETKLFAKMDAAHLLRAELSKLSWVPQVLALSGVTDAYQPVERKLGLTRECLKVLVEFRNPVVIITKNELVTRDIDLLMPLAEIDAARVVLTLTTLDPALARAMEPRASQPKRRLKAIEALRKASIPVSVSIAPIIPGLTDHEIPHLLKQAAQAGALSAHYTILRLPHSVKDLFQHWLEKHYPLKKQKVLHRVQEVRGGKLYVSQFGTRMRGEGIYADHIEAMFTRYAKLYGLNRKQKPLSSFHFKRALDKQLVLL